MNRSKIIFYFKHCVAGYQQQFCPEPLDLVLVLDSSLSIQDDGGNSNWLTMLHFLSVVSSRFRIAPDGVRVGILTYSSRVAEQDALQLHNGSSAQLVSKHLSRVNFLAGNTNTSGAFRYAMDQMFSSRHGDRPRVTNVVVLITDGFSNVEKDQTFTESARLRHAGVRIFTVGVSPYVSKQELEEIASDPYQFYGFHVSDIRGIDHIADGLTGRICEASTPRTTRKFTL